MGCAGLKLQRLNAVIRAQERLCAREGPAIKWGARAYITVAEHCNKGPVNAITRALERPGARERPAREWGTRA
jgi:hypothetical protein